MKTKLENVKMTIEEGKQEILPEDALLIDPAQKISVSETGFNFEI